jgi:dihydroxy-acid dehydratase
MEARVFDEKKLPRRRVTAGSEQAVPDAVRGTLSLRLDAATLEARKRDWSAQPDTYISGAIWNHAQGVGPVRKGAATHFGGAAEVVSYADL